MQKIYIDFFPMPWTELTAYSEGNWRFSYLPTEAVILSHFKCKQWGNKLILVC